MPLLHDLGVRRLAAVFVSHPHPDHVLGLRAVLDAFPVDAAYFAGEAGEGEVARVLARLGPATMLPGSSFSRAGVRFEVLGGERTDLAGNDGSLVLRVSLGRTAFLFPGDVEARGEEAAVRRGSLRADVVKVPHHGSRSSSSPGFVAAVAPAFAVISVGAGNRFGFPHGETLRRWRHAGADVLRTDKGACRFLSNGERVRMVPAGTVLDPLATLHERP